jgi:hypothetical protein
MSTEMKNGIIQTLYILLGGIPPKKYIPEWEHSMLEAFGGVLPYLQLELREYFDYILKVQKDPEETFLLPNIRRCIRVFDGDKLTPTALGEDQIVLATGKEKAFVRPGILTLRVFDLMFGRSMNIIKVCVSCKKLFCYLPKKNKRYCSSACSWRASKQRYREKFKVA